MASDEQWLCQCENDEHGPLGCTRGADQDESLCPLCQDDIHEDENDE